MSQAIPLGAGTAVAQLLLRYGNRHGLIAGATGTGKSVSLMLMAEGFSRAGVPVFLADVKGDLAGLALAGEPDPAIAARLSRAGVSGWCPEANPVVFWDLHGQAGHPIRATVSQIGPMLLGRMLEVSEVQAGVLEVAFRLADDNGWLLLDLDDLRALLAFVAANRKEISAQLGLVSAQSVAAIQRALLAFERDGGATFLGEPALELRDLFLLGPGGRGAIHVLAADQLILRPRLYSSFLLWLLSELFEQLPEVGDLERPKLVFFFDEAHLLFADAPPALRQRVEQVVRLIRSRGVGVYFCTQSPSDVPGEVLGQLGNRVQHALRAFTPRDQKAVRAAAETFVPNPAFDVAAAIGQLAVGEALVSTLGEGGVPTPVERIHVAPPRCRIGAISHQERAGTCAQDPVGARYDQAVNRESAYELLMRRAEQAPDRETEPTRDSTPRNARREAASRGGLGDIVFGTGRRQGLVEAMSKSAAHTVGRELGRQMFRGVLGGLLGRR